LDLDAEADKVLARVGQVKSVILNLMVNALEAQPEGGRLDIKTNLASSPESGGPILQLHFRDGGKGIPPEIRDRVFEPFFSTKAGGSGIGLAMASQAVQDCMGDLYLEPSLSAEAGAEFVVALPLAAVETAVATNLDSGLDPWSGVPATWKTSRGRGSSGSSVPSHLMTPEGLKALLALSKEHPEEGN
jgi:signal transduction histidine kinase